jgi:hypothetical protein
MQGAWAQFFQPGEVVRDDDDGQALLAAHFLE